MCEKAQVHKDGTPASSSLLVPLVLALALLAGVIRGAQSTANGEAGTLLLVRDWDPQTGELRGRLPNHQVAMNLELLGTLLAPPHFDLNEAMMLFWIPRPDSPPRPGRLTISPPTCFIEGERYVPAEKEANVVRIGKYHFLIREIIFVGPEWKRASEAKAAGKRGRSKKARHDWGPLSSGP